MSTAINVTTGKPRKAGSVYYAPLGTALPTDASTALAATYVALGYVSDDGVTNSNAPSSDTVNAWGGDPVLYTQGAKEDTWQYNLIEAMNPDVLKAVYNAGNVTGDLETGITVKATNDESTDYVWVIDMIMKGGVLKRIVIPDGKITDMDDITYNDSDPVGYNVTTSALPDSTGVTHYEYIKSPATGE